jgi:N-acetylmuramoyl-L-alanine amidase
VWAVQGSPPLLKDGKSVVHAGIARDQTGDDIWQRRATRSAAGIRADGKVVLVRTYDEALVTHMDDLMLALGCVDALNGDGGGSSYLYPADNGWGRKVGAAITVKEAKDLPIQGIENVNKIPTLIIDPGHGGRDPGGGSNQFWLEKDLVLKISLYQAERFKQLGLTVALTRETDVYIAPDDRTKIIRESGAKYCISNHINAGGGDGAELIHSIYADTALCAELAEEIKRVGQNVRRTFSRTLPSNPKKDYYFMHRDTGAVHTVIVEYGFADSKQDDVEQLKDWIDDAEAVVKGYCDFIKHPYVAPRAADDDAPTPLPIVQKRVGVELNGQFVGAGYLIEGVSYVPVRMIAELFGAQVDWEDGNVKIGQEAK